jgi:hypothetical protein
MDFFIHSLNSLQGGLAEIIMGTEKTEFTRLALEEDEHQVVKKRNSVRRQYLVTLTLDLLAFSFGASCGWTSASIPLLRSEESPLDSGAISLNDASWIASGICVGGFAGNLLVGWVSFFSCITSKESQ